MAKFISKRPKYFLSLGSKFAAFKNGTFETNEPHLISALRKCPAFGVDFTEDEALAKPVVTEITVKPKTKKKGKAKK